MTVYDALVDTPDSPLALLALWWTVKAFILVIVTLTILSLSILDL
jgi:hypothetical protein